jgi:hypothetical protein
MRVTFNRKKHPSFIILSSYASFIHTNYIILYNFICTYCLLLYCWQVPLLRETLRHFEEGKGKSRHAPLPRSSDWWLTVPVKQQEGAKGRGRSSAMENAGSCGSHNGGSHNGGSHNGGSDFLGGNGDVEVPLCREYQQLCAPLSFVHYVSTISGSSSSDRVCCLCADMVTGRLISAEYRRDVYGGVHSGVDRWQCFNSKCVQLFTPTLESRSSLSLSLSRPTGTNSHVHVSASTGAVSGDSVCSVWVNSM